MRAAIYLRVSTREQSTDMQRQALETVASQRGWAIVSVHEDAGISGAKGRDKRPAFDALLKAAARRQVDVIMAWSIDRLGRSLQDLIASLSDMRGAGCELYLHTQAVDTTTPTGRALFGMLGVFAEFEREMIRSRVVAGLERAKARGRRGGRPKIGAETGKAAIDALESGKSQRETAKMLGVSVGYVANVAKAARERSND